MHVSFTSCMGSVHKMVSYLIGGVMVSMLALSVLDPRDRAPVWSNQRLYKIGIWFDQTGALRAC
jgi:hypothetical protein